MLWHTLINMWDLNPSASKGLVACRGLYVFAHESPIGNMPSHLLFEKINIHPKGDRVARSHKDYLMEIDEQLPEQVKLHKVVHTF